MVVNVGLHIPNYVQQSLHSHPTGFHFLIFDLNSNKELDFFILSGTLAHTLDPQKDNVSVPYFTVFTVFTLFVHKLTPLLRLYGVFLILKILLVIAGFYIVDYFINFCGLIPASYDHVYSKRVVLHQEFLKS